MTNPPNAAAGNDHEQNAAEKQNVKQGVDNSGRQDGSSQQRQTEHDDRNAGPPTSPAYPPFAFGYVDPVTAQYAYDQAVASGYDPSDPASFGAYIYPLSPQFSMQYYPEFMSGYQSYPGSPAMHPQSPPLNPNSPPFTPTFQFQQGGMPMSPPAHAFVLPPGQHFPPLHLSSPVLTGTNSAPGSPPHQMMQRLPGSYNNSGNRSSASGSIPRRGTQQDPQQQQLAQQQSNQFHTHNIYVRGLDAATTDDGFADMCIPYGPISSSKAIIEQKTGECKGYGFAMFENEEDAQNAIEGLNRNGLQASFARVGQESFSARLRSLQDETSANIYVSNLPPTMNEPQLEEMFKPFHTVSNRILRDPQTGLSRGVGFARMSDRAAAISVIETFNGHTLPGSNVPLQVRFADSLAQKRLKGQTARKRVWRARDFQPMAGFPARPMQMPITPETMLGFASTNNPATSQPGNPPYMTQPNFAQYPNPQQPYYNDNDQLDSTSKIDSDLSAAVENKLKIEKEEDGPKTE
ncbi:hypothetical protein INT43_008311 [Umbelopsis isabellina]|uniref:RRM domain-containing protein n=1 Tax=Mortierella isabellina TaxID=91625 RepID=A0A8H7PCW7_MORIS|nr:hypothetical protein INT43_008311 [Umbelopsis isabellina]